MGEICVECHSTITANYRGGCVTCLRREIDRLESHNTELWEKAGHNTCVCSLDKPGDRCMHHSPLLMRAESEAAKWKGLYEKAWLECSWHRRTNEECGAAYGTGTWIHPDSRRKPIDQMNDHDAARREAGLEGNP